MADNLFKDSDPNCGVPEVPVVDFKFVDDCFIEPTPPPIFECVLPPVPNEPCIECPTFDGGGTINVGYTDPGDLCPKEPRIEVKVEKKSEACEYDLTVDLDIPIPRPPCPEINVNTFEVQTRFNSPGCCTEYETDVNVDLYDDLSAVDSALIPNRAIVRTTYAAAANVITVNTIEERNALLDAGGPSPWVPNTVVRVLQPELTAWKLTTIFNEDVATLTWMPVAANEFAKYWINDGTETAPLWRELVPENSPEACENVFTVTPRRRPPVDCTDPGECAFDIDLKITVPIPRIPCPEINVTTFNVDSHWEREECCPAPIDVESLTDRDALTAIEAPVGAHVKTQNPPALWERVQTESGVSWAPVTEKCQNRFEITTRHVPPVDCNDPGQCIFDIDLEIDIPLPPIPCPTISGRVEGPAVGYEDRPCVECVSDVTVRNQSKLGDIPADQLKQGMYVAVTERAAFYTLGSNLTTWSPAGYDRPIRSTNELDAIPADERDNVFAKLSKPPELYKLDSNYKWQPIYAPEEDFTVSSLAERDALPTTTAPVDSVVKISTPVSFWKRINASVWTEISATENFDLTVQPVGSASATVYALSTTTAPVNSIVRVAAGVNFWLRTGNATWASVANPAPTKTVNKFDDLDKIEEPSPGDVVKLKTPPNRFSFVGGEWVPQNVYEDIIVVYSEEDLNSVDQDEREAGMLVEVRNATDRYRLVGDPESPIWEPARCPKNKFEIFTRKKKPKDCKDPGECKFDIVLELVIPIPKPPCPVINIDGFKVTSGFTGPAKNQDDTCPECESDITVENYRDAELAAAEAEPGTTINLTSPAFRYQLEEDLVTWKPAALSLTINVQNSAALDALVAAGEYPTGDPENPVAPLLPGQRVTVANPDDFYRLDEDLVTWEPERVITNVPPSKLVYLNDTAELQTFPADQRFAGLYARIENPQTDLTLNADGATWGPTVPDREVNTEKDRDEIPEEERSAGMYVFVKSATTRVRVGANGKLFDAPCPRNVFTVTSKTTPGKDCNEPDQCEFDINLEIFIPIPRIPCPIINIKNFKVRTRFTGGDNDDECCIERDALTLVQDVANIEARDALSFEAVPQGGWVKTTNTNQFWVRTGDVDPTAWAERTDPNAPICGNIFTITPRHRSPENCQDPGQCEFEIDLFINIPIPRLGCPKIEGRVDVVSGYEDSPCVGCDADLTVKDKAALDGIPEDQREEGMYVKVEDAVTALVWTGDDWEPAATDVGSDPDETVANWEGVLALGAPENGTTVEIVNPPNEFIIGVGAQVTIIAKDGPPELDEGISYFVYDWEPIYGGIEIGDPTNVFNSIADRDAYFRGSYVGYHSVTARLLNPPTRYRYSANRLNGQLPPGWEGINTSNDTPEGELFKDENEVRELDTDNLAPGTVVTLDNPTNRYKYENGEWVPAPCPKSSFRIKTRHRAPENCDDPGECAFDIEVDIVVPIPRPPCPEININTFEVEVKDKDCVESKENECAPDKTVDSIEARDALLAPDAPEELPDGAIVFVSSENKTYQLAANRAGWTETAASTAGDCCTNRFSITTRHEDNKIRKTLDSVEQLNDKEIIGSIEPGQVVAVKQIATSEVATPEDLPAGVANGTIVTTPGENGKKNYWQKQSDGTWLPVSDRTFWRRGPKNKDTETSLNWEEIALDDADCDNDQEKCIFDVDLNLCIKIPIPCPQVNAKTKTNVGYEGQPCVDCVGDKNVKNKESLPEAGTEDVPPENECDPEEEYKNDYYVTTTQVQARFRREDDTFVATGYEIPVNRPEDIANLDPSHLEGAQIFLQDPPKFWQYQNGRWVPSYPPKPGFTTGNQSELDELPEDRFPPGSVVSVRGSGVYQRQPDGSWEEVPDYNDVDSVENVSDLEGIENPTNGQIIGIKKPTPRYTIGPDGSLIPDEQESDWYVFEESDLDELSTGEDSPVPDGGIVEVAFPTDRWQLVRVDGENGPLYSWQPARCPKNQFRIISQKKKKEDCDETSECILHFFTEITVPIPVPPCPVFTSSLRTSSFYETCSECKSDFTLQTFNELITLGPIGKGADAIKTCKDLPSAPVAEGATVYVKGNDTRWRWITHLGGWVPAPCESALLIVPRKTFDNGECGEPPACEFDVILDIQVPIPTPPCPEFNIKRSEVNICNAGRPRAEISINQRDPVTCAADLEDDLEVCDDRGCVFDFDFKLDIPCPVLRSGLVKVWPVHPDAGVGGAIVVTPGACETIPPEECEPPAYTVQDTYQRDRKVYEIVFKNNQSIRAGMIVQVNGGSSSGGTAYYQYLGGAECKKPRWKSLTVIPGQEPPVDHVTSSNGPANVENALETKINQLIAQESNDLIGSIFKTQQPTPHGTRWRYLGGLESETGRLQWEVVPCYDTEDPLCAFDFNAAIAVPFCTPSMQEDEFAPDPNNQNKLTGIHTGVLKEERFRIFYLKPDEECPVKSGDDCPDWDVAVEDHEARDNLLGKAPALVDAVVGPPNNRRRGKILLADGLAYSFMGELFQVKDNPGHVTGLPLIIEPLPCGEDGEPPCPDPDAVPQLVNQPGEAELGKPPMLIFDGAIVKTNDDQKLWQLFVFGGGAADPRKVQGFIAVVCEEDASFQLIVKPDKFDKCKLRYCEKVTICQRQTDHIAKCTQYYGDACCDTEGCDCDQPIDCCNESEKEEQKDGSYGTGEPEYYRKEEAPADQQPAQFKAQPIKAPPLALGEIKTTKQPRLKMAAEETINPNEPHPNDEFADPTEDPCVVSAEEASTGCPEDTPTDKGYRPYKSLELRIREEYPADRKTPPKVYYNLEAAMNCLHGGTVRVKKGTRPAAPDSGGGGETAAQLAPTGMQAVENPVLANTSGETGGGTGGNTPSPPCEIPDNIPSEDLGWGCIKIENNRVNLEITLFTAACPTDTETTPPGGGSSTISAMYANPDDLSFLPPEANFANPMLLQNPPAAESPLTPALLESFIQAINTNPELKAAIRKIVNEPD